ncbi:TonB-dependent receptor plug domain-containing protein [Novosphingobium rosa]|uniref:TonB-dependent receptor plug domain-containing protein n=1 Tax=Novosphingobium rosa TaxID=76978 RepID=UPI00083639F2|nr:TonB-dependent receptor [Novosphingobium rosa]
MKVKRTWRSLWLASAAACASVAGVAQAAPDDAVAKAPAAAAADDAAGQKDAIIVTGLRGVPRTVTDSPAPIEVVDGAKFAQTGSVGLTEGLAKALPALNFGANDAGFFSVVRNVSNRGLPSAYTLVLVNGKRRHNSSLMANAAPKDTSGANAPDLDLIPAIAVGKVEVLKDSAAAQYGSDAIAGVFNLNLDHSAGFKADFTDGESYNGRGNRNSWKAQIAYGLKIGDTGWFHIAADYRFRGMNWWTLLATDTNAYGLPSGSTAAGVAAASGQSVAQVNANIAAANARNAAWNRDGAQNGDPRIRAHDIVIDTAVPLGSLELYGFGTYSHRDSAIGNNYRRANGTADFSAIFPDGYYPLINFTEHDAEGTIGLRGQVAGWHVDLSTDYGKNRNHEWSQLNLRPALGPTGPTFWPNLATFEIRQWDSNLDVNRNVDIGLAAPLTVAAGLEYRRDAFQTWAGDPSAWQNASYYYKVGDQTYDWNVGALASPVVQGAIVLSASDAVNASRGVFAQYLDLSTYVTKAWFVDAAIRAEQYSDSSGNPLSVKFNSRYDISPVFALRGTVGSGFRAPSLTQTSYTQTDGRTAVVSVNGVSTVQPTVAKLVNANSALGRQLGAQPLRAERSLNAGLGVVFTPARNVNVTLDGYWIRINNRIERSGRLYGSGIDAILNANGVSGTGTQVEYFLNAANTNTIGLDLVADYRKGLGTLGKVNLTVAFDYNRTRAGWVAPLPALLNGVALSSGSVFFGNDRRGELTDINPKTKLNVNANWQKGIFTLNASTTLYGAYWYRQASGDDRHFDASWITDASISARVTRFATLQLGATNLFNVRPGTNGPGSPQTGQGYYGPSPYNPSGGYYYGRVAFSF